MWQCNSDDSLLVRWQLCRKTAACTHVNARGFDLPIDVQEKGHAHLQDAWNLWRLDHQVRCPVPELLDRRTEGGPCECALDLRALPAGRGPRVWDLGYTHVCKAIGRTVRWQACLLFDLLNIVVASCFLIDSSTNRRISQASTANFMTKRTLRHTDLFLFRDNILLACSVPVLTQDLLSRLAGKRVVEIWTRAAFQQAFCFQGRLKYLSCIDSVAPRPHAEIVARIAQLQ